MEESSTNPTKDQVGLQLVTRVTRVHIVVGDFVGIQKVVQFCEKTRMIGYQALNDVRLAVLPQYGSESAAKTDRQSDVQVSQSICTKGQRGITPGALGALVYFEQERLYAQNSRN